MRAVFLFSSLLGTLHTCAVASVPPADIHVNYPNVRHSGQAAEDSYSTDTDESQSTTVTDILTMSFKEEGPFGDPDDSLQADTSSVSSGDSTALLLNGESEAGGDNGVSETSQETRLNTSNNGAAAESPRHSGRANKKTKASAALGGRRNIISSLLKKYIRHKRLTSEWEFQTKYPPKRSSVLKHFSRAKHELKDLRALTVLTQASTGQTHRPFFTQYGPGDPALAELARCPRWQSEEGKSSASGVRPSKSNIPLSNTTLNFRAVFSDSTLPVVFTDVVSSVPLIYAVSVRGQPYILRVFPTDMDLSELQSVATLERLRVHSFVRFSAMCNGISGLEAADQFRWHLLVDALTTTSTKQQVVLPGGVEVVNYFVLQKKMSGTLTDFVERAARLEFHEAATVFAARAGVSLQVLELMSLYVKEGICFASLSTDSFEFSEEGVVYLSALSPWYRIGRPYHVVDETRGLYKAAGNKSKRGGPSKSVVVFDEQKNAGDIVSIIITVWCGEKAVEGLNDAGSGDKRFHSIRALLSTVQKQWNCLPHPFHKFLAKLVRSNKNSMSISEATSSSEWAEMHATRENAVQLCDLTRTE